MKLLNYGFLLINLMLKGTEVNFATSMNIDQNYTFIDEKNKVQIEIWKSLYEMNNLNFCWSNMLKIPRIIHQIWLGPPLPSEFIDCMNSWKVIHPDWSYKLWTNDDVRFLPLQNRRLFEQAKNYGQKSDILRYEILNLFGGLYVDVDFRCLKRFDILHYSYSFYTGIGCVEPAVLFNGLIASCPGHPIILRILEYMQQISSDSFMDIIETTGPVFFTKCFSESIMTCSNNVVALPSSFFYPSPAVNRYNGRENQNKDIKPESFAIHYWSCSWQRKEANL